MKRPRLSTLSDLSSEESAVNMTPLIDVVFVVLIMFIIIAPMLEVDQVQLASGPEQHQRPVSAAQENSPVSIYVRADNSIWIQGRKVNENELLHMLKEAKKLYPQKIPQLFQDKKGQFGTYQTVKNAVETAGFEQLDIVLQPG